MRLDLVRDWMAHQVVEVTPDTSVSDADNLLVAHEIRHLPVVENGRIVGIVTYGDIRGAQPSTSNHLNGWERQYLTAQLVVAEIMTADPITISPDNTVGEAAQLMLTHKIGCLPVIDHDGRLAGIITESDIFRLVVRGWLQASDESTEPYAHYG